MKDSICIMSERVVKMDYEISNIQQLLNILKNLKENNSLQANIKAARFFRGQSDYSWELKPGLYRNDLFNAERILLNEAIHRYPKEFNLNDKFSTLVKMQHYGLKTRLLDLTENPLVALYFACSDLSDKDGSLYIFNNVPTFYSNSALVEIFMEYIFMFSGYPSEETELLNHFKNINISDYSRKRIENIEDLIYDLTLQGVYVMPKMNNSRLIAQQGVFLLFGMKLAEIKISDNPGTLGKKYCTFEPNNILDEKALSKDENIIKIMIKKDSKPEILNELAVLNITEATLFTDLDHQLKYINKFVTNNKIS